MQSKRTLMGVYLVIFFCLFFLTGVGVSQATLMIADEGQYPLIGSGAKIKHAAAEGPDGNDGMDSIGNVNWLLDGYYQRDVDVFSIGKFEEEYVDKLPTGELIPLDFSSPWDPDWFTWDGTILDAKEGIGYINIPSDRTFNWTGRFWYSIKAGDGFGLYDGGIMALTAGVSYSVAIPWDIDSPPANFTDNGLSHFSLWAEASPVPEPATILLFGTGLIGIAGLRLRRKHS